MQAAAAAAGVEIPRRARSAATSALRNQLPRLDVLRLAFGECGQCRATRAAAGGSRHEARLAVRRLRHRGDAHARPRRSRKHGTVADELGGAHGAFERGDAARPRSCVCAGSASPRRFPVRVSVSAESRGSAARVGPRARARRRTEWNAPSELTEALVPAHSASHAPVGGRMCGDRAPPAASDTFDPGQRGRCSGRRASRPFGNRLGGGERLEHARAPRRLIGELGADPAALGGELIERRFITSLSSSRSSPKTHFPEVCRSATASDGAANAFLAAATPPRRRRRGGRASPRSLALGALGLGAGRTAVDGEVRQHPASRARASSRVIAPRNAPASNWRDACGTGRVNAGVTPLANAADARRGRAPPPKRRAPTRASASRPSSRARGALASHTATAASQSARAYACWRRGDAAPPDPSARRRCRRRRTRTMPPSTSPCGRDMLRRVPAQSAPLAWPWRNLPRRRNAWRASRFGARSAPARAPEKLARPSPFATARAFAGVSESEDPHPRKDSSSAALVPRAAATRRTTSRDSFHHPPRVRRATSAARASVSAVARVAPSPEAACVSSASRRRRLTMSRAHAPGAHALLAKVLGTGFIRARARHPRLDVFLAPPRVEPTVGAELVSDVARARGDAARLRGARFRLRQVEFAASSARARVRARSSSPSACWALAAVSVAAEAARSAADAAPRGPPRSASRGRAFAARRTIATARPAC